MSQEFTVQQFPRSRLTTIDVGRIGRRKHHIIGLMEADVTVAKEILDADAASGRTMGLTAWVIKVVAETVADEEQVHAMNLKGVKQVIFDDVDVALPISRRVEGKEVPLVGVIREANKKSVTEIHAEIRAMKQQEVKSEKDYVLGRRKDTMLHGLFLRLPIAARMLIWGRLLASPFTRKEKMGTVMITHLGDRGLGAGWIIPKSIHNLSIGIGSVALQPWVVDGQVVPRNVMKLTLLFDHDVVDGLPAARFASKLVANLQQARWLDESR